jgi:hypothetical protein
MRVLLAVDGSPYSEAAVNEVASRIWPELTEVRVITAYELPLAPAPETWALPPDYFDKLDTVRLTCPPSRIVCHFGSLNG